MRNPNRPYFWPASRITEDQMHKLHQLSLATHKPITTLLSEAIDAQLANLHAERLLDLEDRIDRLTNEAYALRDSILGDDRAPKEGDAA